MIDLIPTGKSLLCAAFWFSIVLWTNYVPNGYGLTPIEQTQALMFFFEEYSSKRKTKKSVMLMCM